MKKWSIATALALLFVLLLTACGSSASTAKKTTPSAKKNPRTLVVYFSRTGEQYDVGVINKGNTEIAAEMIAKETGADLYEIVPEENYPITYSELTQVAQRERTQNARPKIKNPLPDLSNYDTIFIGSPVWWGDWPMIMYTYFESNDFTGKTLIPFSTSGGSGLAGFDEKLKAEAPGATVREGLGITGADCQNDPDKVRSEIHQWLGRLGY